MDPARQVISPEESIETCMINAENPGFVPASAGEVYPGGRAMMPSAVLMTTGTDLAAGTLLRSA